MPTNLRSAWPQVVGQAWADEEFRQRLMENPRRVLGDMGVEIPADHRLELLEDSEARTFLVLPKKPAHLDALASASGPSLNSIIRADACTPSPADACTPKPFACTPGPADACTPRPDACTPKPADACTPKPFACTPGPADACTPKPYACTPAPKQD
jgi:hypothetical protein